MTRKFLTDQEINLNENDFLKTKDYAINIAKIISNTDTDKVFTIGLYGSWGSGKSSIIETAKQNFDEKKDKVKFVTYDAWQYSNDSFRRMFLRTLSKELNYSETDFMKRFYENESMDVDNRFKLSSDRVSLILFGLLVTIIIIWALPIEIDTKVPIYAVFTVLSLLITLFTGAFHQLKISVTKPYFFAPEQFEECFKEIATKSLKTNSIKDDLKYLVSNDKTVKNLKKLVIVIDNIDRCNSEIAYQLLTDIKTFLGNQKFSIVFVIPVDDKALLKNFFSKETNTIKHNEKEEFLRKIFNVTMRLKPYSSTDMFAFTKSICYSNNLNLKNETINIIGKEYSSNPRRVIQLLNNLIIELNQDDENFTAEYETIICCILIIKEDYTAFYDLVCKNPSILINNHVNVENLDAELLRFMRIANTEFRDTSIGVLNKILRNSNNHFKDIPIEITDLIDTFNIEKLTSFLNENEKIDEDIYSYLCHKIEEAYDNELKSDLSIYFQFLGIIILNKNVPSSVLFIAFEKLKDRIEEVFHYANDINVLMKLIEFAENHHKKYNLKNLLIDKIEVATNSSNKEHKERWLMIYNALIINLDDDETSKKIKDDYQRKYTDLISVEQLTDKQFKILVTKQFVENRINEVTSTDLENKNYKELKTILSRYENKLFVIDTAFQKFNSDSIFKDDLDARFWYLELLNNFVNYSKEFIIKYDGKFLEKNIQTIFSDLHFEAQNNPSSKLKLFERLEKDNKKITELLNTVKNYYSFTKNFEIIEKYVLEIYSFNPIEVRAFLVDLVNDKIDISLFYDKVSNSFDFSENNLIFLFRHFLTISDKNFHEKNKLINERIIKSLSVDLEVDELRNTINETFEHVIAKTKSKDLIFEIFNQKIISDGGYFLKYLSPNLKKMFAKDLVISDYIKLNNNDILTFCFEVDDDLLNENVIDIIQKTNYSISSFGNQLDFTIPFFSSNIDKKLTKLLARKLNEKFENGKYNANNHNMRVIINNINIIKAFI